MPSTAPGYQKCRAHRNCKVQRGESRTGGDECRPPQCGTTQARSRGPEQQRNTSKQTRSWDEMTPGTGFGVFPNHGDFPESILKILAKQSGQGGSGPIPGGDPRGLPNPTAGRDEPQVQFVVLI